MIHFVPFGSLYSLSMTKRTLRSRPRLLYVPRHSEMLRYKRKFSTIETKGRTIYKVLSRWRAIQTHWRTDEEFSREDRTRDKAQSWRRHLMTGGLKPFNISRRRRKWCDEVTLARANIRLYWNTSDWQTFYRSCEKSGNFRRRFSIEKYTPLRNDPKIYPKFSSSLNIVTLPSEFRNPGT